MKLYFMVQVLGNLYDDRSIAYWMDLVYLHLQIASFDSIGLTSHQIEQNKTANLHHLFLLLVILAAGGAGGGKIVVE